MTKHIFDTMNKIPFLLTFSVLLFLSFSASADDHLRGDCNEDGMVNISDVTDLINYLLTDEWSGGTYDEGYWVVFTEKDGTETYYQLDNFYNDNIIYCGFNADSSLFMGFCPFHYRINGVNYGAEYFLTETIFGGVTFENPLVPGNNYYTIPIGLYRIGIIENDGAAARRIS